MKPVKWGILGTASIACERVIPAMQASPLCDVAAIASRDPDKAQAAAHRMRIPKAHGSYEALLADPDIEAIYNPLPNHLHLEWTVRALEAGKHVLCEKPIAMDAAQAQRLVAARDRTGCLVEEAVMVREHPQWTRLRELMAAENFGDLNAMQLAYSYFNADPADIRNHTETGGGALYDLGCYCCAIARLVFGAEPRQVFALMQHDETFGTDRLTSAVLDFPAGHANVLVATQSSRYQMVQVLGTKGWIRAEVPFAHPEHLAARLVVGEDIVPGTEPREIITFEPVNQYRLQGERFSKLVRGEDAPQWRLEDAVANMRTLDALRRSALSGRLECV